MHILYQSLKSYQIKILIFNGLKFNQKLTAQSKLHNENHTGQLVKQAMEPEETAELSPGQSSGLVRNVFSSGCRNSLDRNWLFTLNTSVSVRARDAQSDLITCDNIKSHVKGGLAAAETAIAD